MDPAEMLTLAAITYRGCEFNLSDAHSRKIVYDETARCLETFSKTQSNWELAWGPAGYRPGIVGMDISAMYVVRGRSEPSNIAIVIRGTNFFSPIDWLSNLLIDPIPWEYGGAADDVSITQSTWLGLRILQRLRSGPVPAPPASRTPLEQVQAAESASEAAIAYALLRGIIQGISTFASAAYSKEIRDQITAIADAGSFAANRNKGLQQALADAQQPPVSSGTLFEFLKRFVATATAPVNIYVVGHSKSGALAPALALWLADTQGGVVVGAEQWDPSAKAKLYLYTFAAPTPGNAGFANRLKQKIAASYRLANPYDIVPHAWNPKEIREIPNLYGDQLSALRIPADVLALALEATAYRHEVLSAQWTGGAVPQSDFLQRAAVEHLDFYLKQFGIYNANSLSTLALYGPIP